MKKIFFAILFISFLNPNCALFAADEEQDKNIKISINYKAVNKELLEMQSNLLKKGTPISNTSDYIKTLADIQENIQQARQQDEADLVFVQKRIEALGEAPKDGNKEQATIASKRKEFANEESLIRSKITEYDLILTKIEEVERLISKIRNKALLDNILNRQLSVVSPKNLIHNNNVFFRFVFDILKSPVEWYNNLKDSDRVIVKDRFKYISLMLILSLIITISINIFIRKYLGYKNTDNIPDYSKKFFAAIFLLIAYGLIPATIIGVFLFWVRKSVLINTGLFGLVINKFLLFLLYVLISKAIVKVVFVPKNGKWRLINLDDQKAKSISFALSLSIILISIISFFELICIQAEYPTDTILYVKLLSCAIKTFCIVLITNRLFHQKIQVPNDDAKAAEEVKTNATPEKQSNAKIAAENQENTEEDYGELSIFDKLKLIIYFFCIVIFGISLFGYINLSDFILNHTIFSLLIGGLAYIAANTIEVLFHKFLLLKFWTKNFKIRRWALAKIDIWFGLILNPIVILFTIFVLLGLWGVSTDLLLQKIKKFMTGFSIGGMKISITSILLGIFVYFVSMSIFKIIKVKFLGNAFEKMDIDYSARSSLSSGFSFFGFIASAFFAIAVMGGSISNLAIIAGALSFGVGLGLQNIINNFVSGVLILFERPIKVGDIVNIDGQEGTVKQISIRATELETGTKSSVIIPNANIISGIVVNMTHNNKQTRIDLRFLLDINNDPKTIMDILLKAASENRKVMAKPAPAVSFNDFSNNSLDFTLSCYIMDIANKQNTINDLRIEIFNRFNEAGIKTSLPQRIMHMEDFNKEEN